MSIRFYHLPGVFIVGENPKSYSLTWLYLLSEYNQVREYDSLARILLPHFTAELKEKGEESVEIARLVRMYMIYLYLDPLVILILMPIKSLQYLP